MLKDFVIYNEENTYTICVRRNFEIALVDNSIRMVTMKRIEKKLIL